MSITLYNNSQTSTIDTIQGILFWMERGAKLYGAVSQAQMEESQMAEDHDYQGDHVGHLLLLSIRCTKYLETIQISNWYIQMNEEQDLENAEYFDYMQEEWDEEVS